MSLQLSTGQEALAAALLELLGPTGRVHALKALLPKYVADSSRIRFANVDADYFSQLSWFHGVPRCPSESCHTHRTHDNLLIWLVPLAGVEPARCYNHLILSQLRIEDSQRR
jgi:hypothetical protein